MSDITVDVGEPCAPNIPGVTTCPNPTSTHRPDLTVGAVAGLTICAAVLLTITTTRLRGRRG